MEIILGKWLAKQFNEQVDTDMDGIVMRDKAHEKAVFSKVTKWGSTIYVLMMLMIIIVNLI
jgi:hypothetical protein